MSEVVGMNWPKYVRILRKSFEEARRDRRIPSLRAFSQLIGLDHSTVSRILQGRRPLSIAQGVKVLENLDLGEEEKREFIESLLKEQIKAKVTSYNEKMKGVANHMDIPDTSEILREIADEQSPAISRASSDH